ncbi:Transcription factor [Sesamum alatum]|uniref:Transcription factor n=1 Tax=Sesamum alatum TaxID=300844 RepID=A0AAE1XZZ1_9LAMI|nr:Transcription factor [Sesamum alatum]
MADDQFQLGGGNWWDASRNRFDGAGTTPASISTTLNAIASFGWPTEMVETKSRSSMDSATPSSAAGHGGVLANQNLQMMGLGLSSQSMDWNQALLGEKGESSFRALLQEDMSSNSSSFQQESGATATAASQEHWRQKLYSGASSEDSSMNINRRGFSLEQPQFSSQASSNDSTITSQTGFQVDSAAAYGLLLSDNQHQHSAYPNRPMNYPYPSSGYAGAELVPSWNKHPQFLRTSPPKQPPPQAASAGSHLHFTNNTPFWNASAPAAPAMTDARSSFFPGSQTQIPAPSSFDEKPKMKSPSEGRDLGTTRKKDSTEASNKRPRGNENPPPLPAFKVRKEKMGDRITALQQLVSPFGKTDTASVLSEAIEYIKFLHEQVSVLSTPYMKNGAHIQHQQNSDKSKDSDGPRQDLRSRGLCLVPISSTFPMTHETTVDFWTPTFGGTFR